MSPHRIRALPLFAFVLIAAFSPSSRLQAQAPSSAITPATPATPASPDAVTAAAAPAKPAQNIYARLVELWSDVPAYHDRLTSTSPGPRKPAELISSFSPALPVPLPEGSKVKVNVALVISDTGKVEAARVLDSTDARFDQAAIDAVKQWLFRPALGDEGPRLSFRVVPIVFKGAPMSAGRHLNVGFGGWGYDGYSPRRLHGRLIVRDQDSGQPLRAGRVVVTHAQDDTGLVLQPDKPGAFYVTATGSISRDDYVRNQPPSLNFSLSEYAPTATKLQTLEGVLEVVIPEYDPNATVTIEKVANTLGSPLRSAALRAQGVTLVLYDKTAADILKAAQGGTSDDPIFGPREKYAPAGFYDNCYMHAKDLAVIIKDPQSHLVGLEFQTADGQPLHYDHNGWYHSGLSTNRVDIYALKLPLDAKMICWLITEKSLQKIPFSLHDLDLPKTTGP